MEMTEYEYEYKKTILYVQSYGDNQLHQLNVATADTFARQYMCTVRKTIIDTGKQRFVLYTYISITDL